MTEDDALTELTAPVAGIILTLMTNLRQCFCQEPVTEDDPSTFLSMLDATPGLGQTTAWGQGSGSRTQFASSLQLVLRGVIDHILLSSESVQIKWINNYLLIETKEKSLVKQAFYWYYIILFRWRSTESEGQSVWGPAVLSPDRPETQVSNSHWHR